MLVIHSPQLPRVSRANTATADETEFRLRPHPVTNISVRNSIPIAREVLKISFLGHVWGFMFHASCPLWYKSGRILAFGRSRLSWGSLLRFGVGCLGCCGSGVEEGGGRGWVECLLLPGKVLVVYVISARMGALKPYGNGLARLDGVTGANPKREFRRVTLGLSTDLNT